MNTETQTDTQPIKKHRVAKRVGILFAVLICVVALVFGIYVNDYYHADDRAVQAVEDTGPYKDDGVSVTNVNGAIAFMPEKPTAGLIFYPGGKVEATAYAPLLQDLTQQGILCVLCPMPFNLAVFNIDAAQGLEEDFPHIKTWYIGGHSLGGSMAASYAAAHPDEFAGLVLLASYSTSDLSQTNLRTLCITGTNDMVINREHAAENNAHLPNATIVDLPQGNHSQFGSYGLQSGDGAAAITPQQQWEETARIVVEWMRGQ